MRVLRNRDTLPANGLVTGRFDTSPRVVLVEGQDGGSIPPTRTEFEYAPVVNANLAQLLRLDRGLLSVRIRPGVPTFERCVSGDTTILER